MYSVIYLYSSIKIFYFSHLALVISGKRQSVLEEALSLELESK